MSALAADILAILTLVSTGKSPWDGWDLAVPTSKGRERDRAYARRRDLIHACRQSGLLGHDGQPTEAGEAALRARARTEAVVG